VWNKFQTRWRRDVLFVKGPGLRRSADDLESGADRLPTGWTVQVLASDVEVADSHARCLGQHGVDLSVLVVEPKEARLTTSRWGYETEVAPPWVAPAPMPAVAETQTALHVTAPPDGDYLAVLARIAVKSHRLAWFLKDRES